MLRPCQPARTFQVPRGYRPARRLFAGAAIVLIAGASAATAVAEMFSTPGHNQTDRKDRLLVVDAPKPRSGNQTTGDRRVPGAGRMR